MLQLGIPANADNVYLANLTERTFNEWFEQERQAMRENR